MPLPAARRGCESGRNGSLHAAVHLRGAHSQIRAQCGISPEPFRAGSLLIEDKEVLRFELHRLFHIPEYGISTRSLCFASRRRLARVPCLTRLSRPYSRQLPEFEGGNCYKAKNGVSRIDLPREKLADDVR